MVAAFAGYGTTNASAIFSELDGVTTVTQCASKVTLMIECTLITAVHTVYC